MQLFVQTLHGHADQNQVRFFTPKLASDLRTSQVGPELGLASSSVEVMPGNTKCNSAYAAFVFLDTQLLDQIWVQITDPVLGRSTTHLVHILGPNLGPYVKESIVEPTAACSASLKKRPQIWARKRTQFGAANLTILDGRSKCNRAPEAAFHRAVWNQIAS